MKPNDEKRELSLNLAQSFILASKALPEHRLALIDDLNRLVGPPSDAMALLQNEFIDDRMDDFETIAFAKFCYDLLKEVVENGSLRQ